MNKYQILLNILDELLNEAPKDRKTYHSKTLEGKNHARSLAYLHLFLKAKFGLLRFEDREQLVTDGTGDGGIDAYYINDKSRVIYFIQAKFRATERNFEDKEIDINELAKMDITRIAKGFDVDEAGNSYNGRIRSLQRRISQLPDQNRYEFRVVVLANLKKLSEKAIDRLMDGTSYEIFNFERTYNEIVLPVCSGSYFDADEITVEIETNDASRSEFNQYVSTTYGEYSIRLIFIPVIEIAKIVSKYRNSLLKYNPRNFLSFARNDVNPDIRTSIVDYNSNNFALLNNGITIIAATDSFNDRIGKKGVGRLTIKSPQIINGGQTAYTLCKILENDGGEKLKGKSVLAKIITPADDTKPIDPKLISVVSEANNLQSEISEADRRANSPRLLEIQHHIFKHYNLLFERKRGEFFEGLQSKYIKRNEVVERVEFVRSYFAFSGNAARSRTSQEFIFEEELFNQILAEDNFDYMMVAYFARKWLKERAKTHASGTYAILAALGFLVEKDKVNYTNALSISTSIQQVVDSWPKYLSWASKHKYNSKYFLEGKVKDNYYKGATLDKDIHIYFKDENASNIQITYS